MKWSEEVKWRSEVKWSRNKNVKTPVDFWNFKCILSWWSSVFMHVWNLVVLGKLKKTKKHLDGLSPTYLKPPPPTPPKNGLCFFSPLFYRSFPIFRHNFYIKSKKTNMKSGLSPRPPPPLWTKSIQCFFFFFFFFLLPIVILVIYIFLLFVIIFISFLTKISTYE